MIRIGSARIDENGRISGGQPGDQTKTEVSEQAYYAHAKGWRAFRCTDAARAAKLAQAMRAACANANIGYSQARRNDLYRQVASKGFDPARADAPTSTDCSALVRVCCAYAGLALSDFTTASEARALLASGAFREISPVREDALHLGDVLVTKVKGHTAIVTQAPDGARVAPGKWNVRSGAGADFAALCTVEGGEALEILETAPNGWLRVALKDATPFGWISPKGVDA